MSLIGLLVNLLILLLVLGVIFWIARLIVGHMGLPPIVLVIVEVILALIFLIWILGAAGLVTPWPAHDLRIR